ncbi:hypothetical protein [Roseomonas genomospecies 6]|uniref:Transcriptional regulator n=1 Tax=Roseomonas genomospecies 6 TaxID=214106 RepID=A0A9W7KR51_9PROT|nr:hypothetical protein [Roseomonas genomospecies 6]KAA0678108.1 hypothetical protein DS843_21230 [Roseomonas genomospecies 6]
MTSMLAKATEAWGGNPPPFVVLLAKEVDRTSLGSAGNRIGYGKAAVSLVLSNRYGAATDAIRGAVMAALGEAVDCPLLGPIEQARCHAAQSTPFSATSPLARLQRASCRACPRRDA